VIARVAFPIPVPRLFDYRVPEPLRDAVRPGIRVRAPLSGRQEVGVLVEIVPAEPQQGEDHAMEELIAILNGPSFEPLTLELLQRVSDDYVAPLGLAAARMLPVSVRRTEDPELSVSEELAEAIDYVRRMERRAPRQVAILRRLMSTRAPVFRSGLMRGLGVSGRQVDRLVELGLIRRVPRSESPRRIENRRFDPLEPGIALLQGSDRLEAYAEWIADTMEREEQVLVLSPEILHATGLRKRLVRATGRRIDLYHSELSDAARGAIWEDVRLGKAKLVVGTRSALFLPFQRLGLVIVDEEQDASYKQSEMLPYYQARDVAVRHPRAPYTVLGASVPSLMTQASVTAGRVQHIVTSVDPLIQCDVVDMRGETQMLGGATIAAMHAVFQNGGRVLIGVAQAGAFGAAVCAACGSTLRCPRCGMSLTCRTKGSPLVCPTCAHTPGEMGCWQCGETDYRPVGRGSESVEDDLGAWFPDHPVVRIDRETFRRGAEALLRELNGTGPIIVATPMIAKGASLPRVELAVAIDMHRMLSVPDFRATERAVQYMVGLAGRTTHRRLIVQSSNPDNEVLRAVSKGRLDQLWRNETEDRRSFGFPPFGAMARLTLVRRDRAKRRADAERILADCPATIEVLGPVDRSRGANESYLTLRATSRERIVEACRGIRETRIPVRIDIDPDRS